MNYNQDNIQSRLITILRFPLLAGVVVIHGVIISAILKQGGDNIDLPVAMFTESLLSRSVFGICVPLFFFISGYLFFLKCDEFGWKLYKEKLRKRFRSLFIPYVIYTCLAITLFGILQVIMPQMQSGAHIPIKDWSIWDFVHNGLWRYGDEGIPFIGPFWFLRNLMVIVVISPLIYWFIRYTRFYGIILLGLLYCLKIWTHGIPGTLGLFFFSWGGYFSIFRKDFILWFRPCIYVSWIAVPLFFIDAAFKDADWNVYLHNVTVLIGVVFTINVVSRLILKHDIKPNPLLLSSTFFVFAAHEPYLDQVTKIVAMVIRLPQSPIIADLLAIAFYLSYCAAIIAILVSLYWLIRRISPKLAAVLSGGRS